MLADQHEHWDADLPGLSPEVKRRQSMAGRDEHVRFEAEESGAPLRHQVRMRVLELRGEEVAHGDVDNLRRPSRLDAGRHRAEGLTSGFGEARPAVGQHETAHEAGIPDGHLQRHEPAVAVPQHDGDFAAPVSQRVRHAVGDGGEADRNR